MFINIEAAQKRAKAAKIRAKAAEIRAEAAKKQGRDAAKRKAIGIIWRFFFVLVPPPLWGALLYFTLSCIGAIYSRNLYQKFRIDIFDFFDTSDFLLSAFQNLEATLIGIGLTLFAIFIIACLVYNSSLYDADSKNGNEKEQKDLVRWEAICLLFLVLVTIGGTLFILSSLSDLKILMDRLTLLLFVVALVVGLLVYLIYYFGRLIYDPASATGQQSLSRWQAGGWLIFPLAASCILAASYIDIFYLWGKSDFLLSAFQNLEAVIIGIGLTLFAIFIVACLVYNSSLAAASKNEQEQKDLVRREAICLLFLVLVTLGGTLLILSGLKVLMDRLILLLFVVAPVVGLLVYLIYYFGRLIYDPASATGQQSLSRWQAGGWLIFLLAASYIAIPYLWGKEDAKSTKKTDLARVTIRQNITTPNPLTISCPADRHDEQLSLFLLSSNGNGNRTGIHRANGQHSLSGVQPIEGQ